MFQQDTEGHSSVSGYFVSLLFASVLLKSNGVIGKRFVDASWREQHSAVQDIETLRTKGWTGVSKDVRLAMLTELATVALEHLSETSWLRQQIVKELAYERSTEG